MPRRKQSRKQIETLVHDEAKRTNIPTAEYSSAMEDDDRTPIQVAYAAPQPRPRPAARLARQGLSKISPTSSSKRHRSTSKRRCTRRC